MTDGTVKPTWWQRLDKTAKGLFLLLTLGGLVGGWFVSFVTNTKVNAMALQKSIDAEVRREERVAKLEADSALTKAATTASLDRIAATNERQAQVNADTAEQVKANAAQLARMQAQLIRVSALGEQIETQEKIIQKLSEEVNDLTKATTKLRRKVKEEPAP